MKIGVVADIEKSKLIYECGFDFMECAVEQLVPEESDRIFKEKLKLFIDSPVPIEAFNCFIPGNYKVVGDAVDYERLNRYVERILQRVHAAGGKIVVFGSGGARKVPVGFPRDQAEEQIVKFLDLVADYADPLGITIAIEPLYKVASNIIHTVPEAVAIAERVNRKSIQVLADFFHMMYEGEPLENMVECKKHLHHIHVSNHYKPPVELTDYPFPKFVDCVQRAGYDHRISIECTWNDFDLEVLPAKQFIFEQFKELIHQERNNN